MLIDIANKTVLHLENMPTCHEETLQELSSQYATSVLQIKEKIKKNSCLLKPYSPYSTGNYLLKQAISNSETYMIDAKSDR